MAINRSWLSTLATPSTVLAILAASALSCALTTIPLSEYGQLS